MITALFSNLRDLKLRKRYINETVKYGTKVYKVFLDKKVVLLFTKNRFVLLFGGGEGAGVS